MLWNRSQLTIVNNLKLETKRRCFWAGSSNDVNVNLSVSFQTCHKRHDRSFAHLIWQSACTIGNKLALWMQFTQKSCELWQCGRHQDTMWHTNTKLKFTPKHSQEPPGGGARLVVINVSKRTFLGARLKVDLAFHLRQVLFLSKFRKKNDSALYTAHAYLYLNVHVCWLQFCEYTINL